MSNLLRNHHPITLTIYCLLMLFFLISPFVGGAVNGHELFLEPYLHMSFIFAAIVSIILSIFLFQRSELVTRTDPVPWLVWLLPICYIISSMSAVATQDAIHSIQIQVFNVVLFLVGYTVSKRKNSLRPLITVLLSSGYLLIFVTMSEWLGTHLINNSVVYSIGDYRIFSALLYPNSYAALMIAFFFVTSYVAVSTESRSFMVLSSFLVVPSLLSLILTYSRGGYLIFVLLFFFILFMMPLIKQMMYLVFSIFSFVLTGIAYPLISKLGIQQQSEFRIGAYLSGWVILLIASALLVWVTIYVIPRLYRSLNPKLTHSVYQTYGRFFIPVLSILIAVGGLIAINSDTVLRLLPEQLQNRLGDLNFRQHSVLERITFYKDAGKIISDYPLTGAGGGAWNALYQEYQNNPYITKKPHNFYLRHTLETGLLGLGILLAFLAIVYYRFIRHRRQDPAYAARFVFFIFATSILIHSLIDFNMEFLYISGLVYLSLGIMASSTSDGVADKLTHSKRNRRRLPLVKLTYVSAMSSIAVIIIIVSSRSIYAHRLYTHTIEELNHTVSTEEAVSNMTTVLKLKPNHPQYLTGMIALWQAIYRVDPDPDYLDYAQKYIDRLKLVDTNFISTSEFEIENYRLKNELERMADATVYWLEKFPWKVPLYETAISLYHDMGYEQFYAGEPTTHWDQAIALYDNMLVQLDRIRALPDEQLPGAEFIITDYLVYLISEIHLKNGEYENALGVIEEHYQIIDLNVSRDILRLYLSVQMKMGILNKNLYEQFISRYPDEQSIIKNLLEI